MASKDLTNVYIEYRSAAIIRKRNSSGGKKVKPFGISSGADADVDESLLLTEDGMASGTSQKDIVAALPPQWVDYVDGVNGIVDDIGRLMTNLGALHSSRLGSVFGQDNDDMEINIDKITRDITSQFRQAERLLQRIGTATQRAGGEEANIGSNVQKSLAKKLQDLNTEFRHKQRKYLKDVQVQKSGGVAETESRFGIDINEREREYGLNETQLSAVVIDDLSEVAQSRDKEIAQIAKSIEELNAIFKELAVLVIDQGTILDRIDYNMESVVENTKAGIKQLEKAENKQKNSRPLKIIICLAITIFILLGILLLKHRIRTALSGGGGSSNNSGSSGNSNNNNDNISGSNTTSTSTNSTAPTNVTTNGTKFF